MSVSQLSITITRGDSYSAAVTFDQLVSAFSEIRFTVRESWATSETDNSTATLSKTLTTSGLYGATLDLTSAETLALTRDSYVYDIQITTVVGTKIYTTQRGKIRVSPDVTRP